MDDGRVPIDLTEEQSSAEAGRKSYTREDDTLVIDILVERPCGESSEREIVVCASDQTDHRLNAAEPTPAEEGFEPEVQLAPDAKASLYAEPGLDGAVRAMVNVTIKF
jgi:hypothetical protein